MLSVQGPFPRFQSLRDGIVGPDRRKGKRESGKGSGGGFQPRGVFCSPQLDGCGRRRRDKGPRKAGRIVWVFS